MTKTPVSASNDATLGGPVNWLDQTPSLLTQITSSGQLAGPAVGGVPQGQSIRGLKAEFDFSDIEGDGPFDITFTVSKKNAGVISCSDLAARLVIGGVTQSTDAAKSGNWPSSLTSSDYTFTGLSKSDVASVGISLAALAAGTYPPPPRSPVSVPQVDEISATVT